MREATNEGDEMAGENKYGVKVGDVFIESWGYDQSNIDAYEVVRVTKASAEIKKIGVTSTGSSQVVPVPGQFLSPNPNGYDRAKTKGTLKRTQQSGYDGSTYLTMTSYSSAYLWDGEESFYVTPIGMGH